MTSYSPERKAEIVEAALQSIATGQSLNAFCKANGLPYMTVSDWLCEDDAVNSARARAIELGTHYLAGECLDIADALTSRPADDRVEAEMTPGERVQVAKARIDTRLRVIGKWNRRDYGDKQELDLTSKGDKIASADRLTPEESAMIAAEIERIRGEV